jgi:hypothetical protein
MDIIIDDAILKLRIHPGIFIPCLKDFFEQFVVKNKYETLQRDEFDMFLKTWTTYNVTGDDHKRLPQIYAAIRLRVLAYLDVVHYFSTVYGRDFSDISIWFIPEFIMAALEVPVAYDANEYAYFTHLAFVERVALYVKGVPEALSKKPAS